MPNTKIKTVLGTKGHVIRSISPDASVFDALGLMAKFDVGALLVIEGDDLVGIISERDYARKVVLLGKASPDTSVKEIMTSDVVCISPQSTVGEAMAIMTDRASRHLPVIDNNKIMGVVSIGDLVKTIIRDQEFVIDQLEHYIHGH
jgi:CBS domain-containing protein